MSFFSSSLGLGSIGMSDPLSLTPEQAKSLQGQIMAQAQNSSLASAAGVTYYTATGASAYKVSPMSYTPPTPMYKWLTVYLKDNTTERYRVDENTFYFDANMGMTFTDEFDTYHYYRSEFIVKYTKEKA
jgi:hypothetical protein